MTNGEGIDELLNKVSGIDYKNKPAEAFLELNTLANTLKQKIMDYRDIQAAEMDIESVNWCINEIIRFRNQNFDSYHEINFYNHQKRIIEAGNKVISGIHKLNEKTL